VQPDRTVVLHHGEETRNGPARTMLVPVEDAVVGINDSS
jgi:hypothetical protein